MTFAYNKDRNDHEQVRPYMDAFLTVYPEVQAAGHGTAYNDSFRGRIPDIEGPDEDRAIYMLQNLRRLDELAARVAAFLAGGGEEITTLDKVRRGTVVHVGYYMGGTGWTQWDQARLMPRDGKPYAVLPKGKRTNGNWLTHRVLFKED